MPRLVLPAAAIVVLSAAALTTALAVTSAETVSGEAALSPQKITEQLLAKGYSKVVSMEMEDGVYEVTVKTSDGKRESLNVDPATGRILGKQKDGFFSN